MKLPAKCSAHRFVATAWKCKHQNDNAFTTCKLRPLAVSNDCLKFLKEVERSYDIQSKIYIIYIRNHRYSYDHTPLICPTERFMMVYVDNIYYSGYTM